MAIKLYNPTTPGLRGMTTQDFDQITAKRSNKKLLVAKKRTSARNNQGRITTRHRGGGAKRFYRNISFKLPEGFVGTVEAVEYDPNRSARIALVKSSKGVFHYIIATANHKPGVRVAVGSDVAIEEGNRLPLMNMPIGSTIHAIEMIPGRGAQMVRSAGNSAQLMGRDNGYAQIKLPSGEIRLINEKCTASIGVVSNEQHQNVKIGKAGRKRHMGFRPTVRGVVQNAVDHPHGGGDGGRHGIGCGKNHGTSPKTPWGQKTLGFKTRSKRASNKFIVRSRHQGKRK